MSATAKHRGSPGDGRILDTVEGDLPGRSTNAGFVLVERHLNFPKSQNARLVFLAPQRRGRRGLSETALRRFTRSISPSKKRYRVGPVSYGGSMLNSVGSTGTAPESGGHGIGVGIDKNHGSHDHGFDGNGRGLGSSGKGHEFGR